VGQTPGRTRGWDIVLAASCCTILAFLTVEVYDLDVWWHLAIGRDVLQRLELPTTDRYAAAALGRPYHDSHWLFQVLLAVAHRLLGMLGVQAVAVVLWCLTFTYAYRAARRWSSPSVGAILVLIAALACVERFLPRPELLTVLGTVVLYYWLQEGRYTSWADAGRAAALQCAWANGHGLFVIGPFLVGCYWAVALVSRLRGRSEPLAGLSRLLCALLLASMLTPWGPFAWRYAILLASEAGPQAPELMRSLGEMSPTFGAASRSGLAFWPFVLLLAGVVVTTAAAWRRGAAAPERLLIGAGLGAAALTGRRNIVLFAIVAAPLLAENLSGLLPRRELARPVRWLAACAIVAVAWLPLSGRYYLAMEIPARFGLGATPSFFPHGLPAFLESSGFRGQVFNSSTLGGFYLFHGEPGRIPLTDGRWEVYDPATLREIRLAPSSPLRWDRLVSSFDIRGLVLQHASPEARALLPRLARGNRWRLVYLDHAASFWFRDDSGATGLDLSDSRTLPPPPSRIDDCLMLELFLRDVGAPALRLENLQRASSFGWRSEMLLERIGFLCMELGRYEDAERTLQALLSIQPRHTGALNELAFLAYRQGRLEVAESLVLRAIAIAPDDAALRANHQRIREALRGKAAGDKPR
jgi:hypothetical protein